MSKSKREAGFLARHHGVISFEEARRLGISRSAVGRRVQSGRWIRIHRGVYRSSSTPPTWEAKARAATLSTGGVLSHRAAARLWGLDGDQRARIEVLVAEGRQRSECAFILHQSRRFEPSEWRTRSSIPVTNIERTILDLAAVVSPTRLGTALDEVLRRKLTTWERVATTLSIHSRRGRNGCGPLRQLLDDRYGTAIPDSAWNRLCGELLSSHGLDRPSFEYEIGLTGGGVARVDLAYPDRRVAIECDSRRYHDNDASFETDRRRHNHLVAAGWSVVMVTWRMFVEEPQRLVDTVARALTNSPIQNPLSGH